MEVDLSRLKYYLLLAIVFQSFWIDVVQSAKVQIVVNKGGSKNVPRYPKEEKLENILERSKRSDNSMILREEGKKFMHRRITYYVNSYVLPPGIDVWQFEKCVKYGLNFYAYYGILNLIQTFDENDADMVIKFSRLIHEDGYYFDGPGITLAHAFFPNQRSNKNRLNSDTHFDSDETWITREEASRKEGTVCGIVAIHEFGHAFGFKHSDHQDSLMAPYYHVGPPTLSDKKSVFETYGQAQMDEDSENEEHLKERREKLESELYNSGSTTEKDPWMKNLPSYTIRPTTTTTESPYPDVCSDRIDAIAKKDNGDLYIFIEKYYWIYSYVDMKEWTPKSGPLLITSLFSKLEKNHENLDAAVYDTKEKRMIAFKGQYFYTDKGDKKYVGKFLPSIYSAPEFVFRIDSTLYYKVKDNDQIYYKNLYGETDEPIGKISTIIPLDRYYTLLKTMDIFYSDGIIHLFVSSTLGSGQKWVYKDILTGSYEYSDENTMILKCEIATPRSPPITKSRRPYIRPTTRRARPSTTATRKPDPTTTTRKARPSTTATQKKPMSITPTQNNRPKKSLPPYSSSGTRQRNPSSGAPKENKKEGPCIRNIDAATIFRAELYLFTGKDYWRYKQGGNWTLLATSKIKMFHGFEDWNEEQVDAAYEDASSNLILIAGTNYYKYSGEHLEGPLHITEILTSLQYVNKIDYALSFDGNPCLFANREFNCKENGNFLTHYLKENYGEENIPAAINNGTDYVAFIRGSKKFIIESSGIGYSPPKLPTMFKCT